jgi:hypothetical protein
MSDSQTARSEGRSIRPLVFGLIVLFIMAATVATRLVATGAGHHNKAVMIELASVYANASTERDEGPPPPGLTNGIALFDQYAVEAWSEATILGDAAVVIYVQSTSTDNDHRALYIWPKSERLSRTSSSSRNVGSTRVDLWSDADRLYGLVRDLP